MTIPIEPPPQQQEQPQPPQGDVQPTPVQVIGYASGETVAGAATGARVALGFLAALHLLVGVPLLLWTIVHAIRTLFDPYSGIVVSVFWIMAGVTLGAADTAAGVWMIVRRPWMWRATHVTMAALCALQLIGAGFFAGVIVYYKHATGWDSLALALGVIFFIACSAFFWLHAVAKLVLLRLNVRRAFFIGDFEPHRLHRVGTFTMMALYALVVLVGLIWFALR